MSVPTPILQRRSIGHDPTIPEDDVEELNLEHSLDTMSLSSDVTTNNFLGNDSSNAESFVADEDNLEEDSSSSLDRLLLRRTTRESSSLRRSTFDAQPSPDGEPSSTFSRLVQVRNSRSQSRNTSTCASPDPSRDVSRSSSSTMMRPPPRDPNSSTLQESRSPAVFWRPPRASDSLPPDSPGPMRRSLLPSA